MFELMDWTEPTSIADAHRLRVEMTSKKMDIESQLANRDVTKDGVRVGSVEYWQWRKRARTALLAANTHLLRLKEWIHAHRDDNKTEVPERTEGERSGLEVMRAFASSSKEVRRYVAELEERIITLSEENEELREMVKCLRSDD